MSIDPRTSPTHRAGADVPVYYITGHDWDFEEDPSPDERSWVRYTDYAALQARIAELEARNAASERDAGRLDYIERTFSGMTNRERYLPVQMIWGRGANGRTLREACDKYMARAAIDAHAQGQAGEEKDGR